MGLRCQKSKRLKQTFSIQSTPGERFYSTQIGTLQEGEGGQLAPFLCRMKTMLLLKSKGGGGGGGVQHSEWEVGGGSICGWREGLENQTADSTGGV